MASTYSTNLAIELIGTGDQAGTWGNTTNTNLGTLIEQAISGYVTQAVSTGTDTTITIPNGATGVARNMYIELTGTGGTNTNLIVPSNKKLYFIFNNASGAVTVKVSGQTGVSVPAGKKVVLASNGTDTVNALNYIADFGSNSATITQLTATSATITNLTLTSLVISNLSIASANVTVLTSASATITNLLATSLTVSSGSTLNGGVVINEPGADVDFRVEGDTDANLIFADASTDRVGVGTNAPGYKLDVQSTSGTIVNIRAANNNNSDIFFSDPDADNRGVVRYNHTSDFMSFWTNGGERARINSAGNLGLDVSPSAWSAFTALQVKNGSISSTGSDFNLMANAYYDGSNYKRIAASGAGRMYFNTDGSMFWAQAGSSTAGSTITFTQAMTLDASSNLNIGGTGLAYRIGAFVASSGTLQNAFTVTNNANADYQIRIKTDETWTGTSAGSLIFQTVSTERARITSGGVTIFGGTGNTNIDANKCFVDPNASAEGGRYTAVGNNGAAGALFLGGRSDTGASTILIRPDGDLENANNSYGAISDERLKQDIVDASSQWNDIKSLRVRKYRFKSDPNSPLQIGVVAQELEKVSPGLVETTSDDLNYGDVEGPIKTVKYSVLYMKSIKALQEAMARIETLEAEMAALKGA